MDNKRNSRLIQRIRNGLNPSLLWNLCLLFVPSIFLQLILFCMPYTYGLSILLLYFILPMFYSIDKRLRYEVNHIGKKKFSFLDGYRDFFLSNKGGIFGVIFSLVCAFGLFLLSIAILYFFMPHIISCFPLSQPYFREFSEKFSDIKVDQSLIMEFFMESGYHMAQPLIIIVGIALFLPLFFVIFIGVDENLSYHYISSVLFPDLDLNISSSQSRTVGKSFSRNYSPYRWKESLKLNFPIYLFFTLAYGFSLFGSTYIPVSKTNVMMFVIVLTPCASIILGTLLNHICMLNNYSIIEEDQEMLLLTMPAAMRTSVYQTFHAKEYIHGEESEKRGSFIKNVSSSLYEKEYVKEEKKKDSGNAVVVDFSSKKGDEQ